MGFKLGLLSSVIERREAPEESGTKLNPVSKREFGTQSDHATIFFNLI